MPGIEQASQKSWLSDDNNRILLATLTAITLAAGSTVLWRAKHTYHTALLSESGSLEEHQRQEEMDNKSTHTGNADVGGGSKVSSKSFRSKERRKRGKDPVKETIKAGGTNTKKGKKRATSSTRSETSNPGTGIVVPEIVEPRNNPEPPSVDGSTTASSSRSRSSSPSYPKDRSLLDVVEPEEELDEDVIAGDTLHTNPIPTSLSAPSHGSPSARVQEFEIIPATQSEPNILHIVEPRPISSPFAESGSGSSSLTSRTSSPAPSTVPETPRDPNDPNINLHPSLSMYSHYTSPPRMTPGPNGSWDYGPIINNQGPDLTTTYIKPPRFRSKSRGSETLSPVQIPSSISYILPPFSASMSPPQNPSYLSSTDDTGSPVSASKPNPPSEIMTDFTFPTLNPSPTPVPLDSAFESSSRQKLGNHSYTNFSSTSHPQCASTPLYNSFPQRTPTPNQNSNQSPQSSVPVSAQTQLASLRGALEAARMREENAKIEVEKLGRECQELRMRWGEDVSLWKMREGELQAHIQMLNQHLQGYASILASMPQTAHLQISHPHLMSPLQPNGTPNPSFSNIYSPTQGSPAPGGSTQPQPQSPRSHPTSPHGNMTSPLSPLAMYPAGMQMPQPIYQGMIMNMNMGSPQMRQGKNQIQQLQATQPQSSLQSPNPNLFSLFFPGTNGCTSPGSGASSGAASPVIGNGSPVGDRGRRRMRAKTATQREQDVETVVEGVPVDEDAGDEDEFSGLLADAILKRPESIRGGRFRAAKQEKEKGKSSEDVGAIVEERQGEVNLNDDGWIRETNPPVNVAQTLQDN